MDTLFHFSENPTIKLFRAHAALTSSEIEPLVWALDEEHRAELLVSTRLSPRLLLGWRDTTDQPSRCSSAGIRESGSTARNRRRLAGAGSGVSIDAIVASGLEFSIIRKANAQPRLATSLPPPPGSM